jgi:uncharacterized delta-60 repeat protein
MKIERNKLEGILWVLVGVFVVMAFSVLEFGMIQPAQAQSLTIEKTWGGTDGHGDLGWGVAVDSSGNVYVVGETGSFGAGGIDALLLKYGPNGTLLWQKTWGGTKDDWGWGIAVDSSRNVYVSGETQSFGTGSSGAFLLKYDPNGTLLWQKTWGATQVDFSLGIAVDSSGNVYVIGGTTSFGAGLSDVLLLKYDPDGTLLWQKTWGGEKYDKVFGVAVDPSGSIYMTGGTESFGTALRDVLLLKYGPDGTLLWQKTWGGKNFDIGFDVAVDSSGSIYVTGRTNIDVFLLKYDSSGKLLWQKTWGRIGLNSGFDVAVDSSGNAYVAGRRESDALLLKYGPDGKLLWQKTWGGKYKDDVGCGIAVDSSGRIYMTGGTYSPLRTLQDISENETEPTETVTETEPTGFETTPDGTVTELTGTETIPDGSETYAGGYDVFLLVFTLP